MMMGAFLIKIVTQTIPRLALERGPFLFPLVLADEYFARSFSHMSILRYERFAMFINFSSAKIACVFFCFKL